MRYSLLALTALAACLTPPPQLAPSQLHVAHTPAEVVQITTRELTLAGFEIAVSDANAGTVVGKRAKTPDEQGADMVCEYKHGSMASGESRATLTESVSAKTAPSGGSDVVINSTVTMDFSNMPPMFRGGFKDSDCASSGAVEKKLAAALAP